MNTQTPPRMTAEDALFAQMNAMQRDANRVREAVREMGWYANTMQSVEIGRAAGILAAKNLVRRPRSQNFINVLRQVEAGVTNTLAIRKAVGLPEHANTFSDLIASGELIRTAPATYALTDKGRRTLEREAGNG